jgi:histidyl-tRNA synthetase
MGMERLAALIGEKQDEKLTAYIVSNNTIEAIKLAEELRANNTSCEFDLTNKKFVKQLEKASKIAKYAIILGEDEITKNEVTLKNLDTSEQETIKRNELMLKIIR